MIPWLLMIEITESEPEVQGSIKMRVPILLLIASCVFSLVPEQGFAQPIERNLSVKIGGGIGTPVGDTSDGTAKINPSFLAGISVPVVGNAHALLEGHYTKLGSDDEFEQLEQLLGSKIDADLELMGGTIGMMLRSQSGSVGIYGLGGIGFTRATVNVSFDGNTESETESTFSFAIGGGVYVPINQSISVVIDARYNHGLGVFDDDDSVQWIPITAAVVFGF